MANKPIIEIGFQADTKQLTESFKGIEAELKRASSSIDFKQPEKDIIKCVTAAKQFQSALEKATLASGTISFSSLQGQLKAAGSSAEKLIATLATGGSAFNESLSTAVSTLALADRTAISLSAKLSELKRVFTQSLKFTAAQAAIRAFSSAAAQGVGWVKELNSQLAEISVVSGYVGEDLDKISTKIVENAAKLKVAASDYADAALLFYQQGLDTSDVEQMSEVTIKAAKAAGTSVSDMASQLTAIKNTYQMSVDEMQRAAAIAANLGASTAIKFEDISEAMQTSAVAASQMGVSYESLAAIIATVGDATQQSASIIGNAYKTIFSRFEQLKSDGTDGEVTLNTVSQNLANLGVNVLDAAGELRELDDVIMEIGTSWETYSDKQQLAIAELVGGTRQYTQFLALMQNFDSYLENKDLAEGETGATLDKQYEAAQDTVTHAAEMSKEAWSKAFAEIVNDDSLKLIYEVTEKLGEGVQVLLKSLGGLPGILGLIGKLLSKNIGSAMATIGMTAKEWVHGMSKSETEAAKIAQSFADVKTQITLTKETSIKTLEAEIQALNKRASALKSSGQTLVNGHKNSQDYKGKLKLQAGQDKLDQASLLEQEAANKTNQKNSLSTQVNASKQVLANEKQLANLGTKINNLKRTGNILEKQHAAALEQSVKSAIKLRTEAVNGMADSSKKGSSVTRSIAKIFNEGSWSVDPTGMSDEDYAAAAKDKAQKFLKAIQEEITNNGSQELQEAFNAALGGLNLDEAAENMDDVATILSNTSENMEAQDAGARQLKRDMAGLASDTQKFADSERQLKGATDDANGSMDKQAISMEKLAGAIVNSLSSLITITSQGISLGEQLGEAFAGSEPDIMSMVTALGMLIPMITSTAKAIVTALQLTEAAIPVVGWILAALTAVAAGISAVISANEKLAEKTHEAAEAAEEEAEAQVTLGKSVQESKKAFDEAYKVQQNSIAGSDDYIQAQKDMQQAVDDLTSTLGESNWDEEQINQLNHLETIAKITGNYEDLKDAINEVYDAIDDHSQASLSQAEASAFADIKNDFKGNGIKYNKKTGKYTSSLGGDTGSIVYDRDTKGNLLKDEDGNLKILVSHDSETSQAMSYAIENTAGASKYFTLDRQEIFDYQNGSADIGYNLKGQFEDSIEGIIGYYDALQALLDTYFEQATKGMTDTEKATFIQEDEYYKELLGEIDGLQEKADVLKSTHEQLEDLKDKKTAENVEEEFSSANVEGMTAREYYNWRNKNSDKYSEDTFKRNAGDQEAVYQKLKQQAEATGSKVSVNDLIDKYDELMENNEALAKQLLTIDTTTGQTIDQLVAQAQQNLANSSKISDDAFKEITSLSDLDALTANKSNRSYTEDQKYEGYKAIASQYDSCAEALNRYQNALSAVEYEETVSTDAAGNKVQQLTAQSLAAVQAAEDELRAAIAAEELAEKYDLSAESIADQALALKDNAKYEKLNREQLVRLAAANQRMNNGVADLTENLDDWKKTLSKTERGSKDYADTMVSLKKAVRDVTGAEENLAITDEFVEDNMDNIEKAAKGEELAINQLGIALAELTTLNVEMDMDIVDAMGLDPESFDTVIAYVQSGIAIIRDNIASLTDGSLSLANAFGTKDMLNEWVTSINQMAAYAGWGADQMHSFLSQAGVSADVVVQEIDQKQKIQGYKTVVEEGDPAILYENRNGESIPISIPTYTTYSVPGKTKEFDVTTQVAQINTDGSSEGPTVEYVGSGNSSAGVSPSSTAGSGGGGSKSSYKKPTAHKRYVNTQNKISNNSTAQSKLSAVEDQLYGNARLTAYSKKAKLIEQQAKNYQTLYQEAKKYAEEDLAAAQSNTWIQQHGGLQLDSEGNLLNEEELRNYLDELKDQINAASDEAKDALQQTYDEAETCLDNYTDSIKQKNDAIEQGISQVKDWIDNKLSELTYELEIEVTINERELKSIEYALQRLGSNGTKFGAGIDAAKESLASLAQVVSTGRDTYDNLYQLLNALQSGENLEGDSTGAALFGEDVWAEAIANGSAISLVLEKMNEESDQLLDYAKQMDEQIVAMWESCTEALQLYLEEFDDLNTEIEQQATILDTWIALWDATGDKYKDSATYLKMLEKQTKVTEQAMNNAESKMWAMQDTFAAAEEAYLKAQEQYANGEMTGEQLEAVKAYYNECKQAKMDAENEYYQAVQDHIAKIQEEEAAAAEVIAETWQQGLNGGLLSTEGYSQQQTLQDYYLDDYEKGYGLTKLSRQVEDAMDGITDPAKMKEYQEYLDDINAKMEDGVELTQEDVDIMQAKLDLMKAQDELEDARNSKNTMKLTRDASGNYSYVYSGEDTSDQEQAVDDAYNNWYELVKGAADTASQSWYEVYCEYTDFIENIDWTRYESEEAYRNEVDRQTAYYQTYLGNLSSKVDEYNGDIGRSYSDTAIGVMTGYENMEQTQTNYTTASGKLIEQLKENHTTYQDKITEVKEKFVEDYGSMSEASTEMMGTVDSALIGVETEVVKLQQETSSSMTQMTQDTSEWCTQSLEYYNAVIAKIQELYEAQTLLNSMDTDGDGSGNGGGNSSKGSWQGNASDGWWYGDATSRWAYYDGWAKLKWSGGEGWFYFDEDGYCLINSITPDGFYVDENGVWDGNGSNDPSYEAGSFKKATYKKYAHGGYTGNFGTSGVDSIKAMLAPGEYVLNDEDTSKILEAVRLVRNMEVNYQHLMDTASISQAADEYANLISAAQQSQQDLEQNVHIDASFPNVSVASEIEDAFNNLVNETVQYITGK